MSFSEVLAELPALTFEQRQELVRRASELDDRGLSPDEEALVAERLAAHRKDPSSVINLEEMKKRVRAHSAQ